MLCNFLPEVAFSPVGFLFGATLFFALIFWARKAAEANVAPSVAVSNDLKKVKNLVAGMAVLFAALWVIDIAFRAFGPC